MYAPIRAYNLLELLCRTQTNSIMHNITYNNYLVKLKATATSTSKMVVANTPTHTSLQFATFWTIWNISNHMLHYLEHIASCATSFGTGVCGRFITHAFDSLILCVVILPWLTMAHQQKNGRKDYVPLLMASFNFEKGRCKWKGIIGQLKRSGSTIMNCPLFKSAGMRTLITAEVLKCSCSYHKAVSYWHDYAITRAIHVWHSLISA